MSCLSEQARHFSSTSDKNMESAPVPFTIISSQSVTYLALDVIGEGASDKVAKCVNLKTAESAAIKILTDVEDYNAELEILEQVSELNPEEKNLVRFIDNFIFQDMPCLAFEMLDTSLQDFVEQRNAPLSLNEIRPITHQLLVALEALKSIGIIHTDLKPDNVMLVNQRTEPFRVKLLNFGGAIPASEGKVGMALQAPGIRPPEVMLGLPISEAIDMWGLGCVLAFLYFGPSVITRTSTDHVMKQICNLLGQPEDSLLNAGKSTSEYPQISQSIFDHDKNLEEAVRARSKEHDIVQQRDRMEFLSLLKQLLDTDAETRIQPGKALQHSFLTMAHLEEGKNTNTYREAAFELMDVCTLDDSDDSDDCLSDSDDESFLLQKGQVIASESVRYLIKDFIGQGYFGKVAKCVNLTTAQSTAIKILADEEDYIAELEILEQVSELNPDKNNVVRFIDNFTFQDMYCLAFEMLNKSLQDFVEQRNVPMSLNEIRLITKQLLVTLKALKSIGIIHTDLKPDNIMLVNQMAEPFRVKLIDFGGAIPASSEVKVGLIVQPGKFRAPEVMLGLPISEAIDMWGLGCVLAFLYFSSSVITGTSTYHVMKQICHLLGQPEDRLLNAGKSTSEYFCREQSSTNQRWRLKTAKEYEEATGVNPQISQSLFDHNTNLEEAVRARSKEHGIVQRRDRMEFLSLLKQLLDTDAETRIQPGKALQHSFLTMAHLEEGKNTNTYREAAFELMDVCTLDDSDDSYDCFTPLEYESFQVQKPQVIITGNKTSVSIMDTISSKSEKYLVMDVIGEGSFGKVLKCVNLTTYDWTAVKILKRIEDYTKELKMLERIKQLDPEETNVVRFIENFIFNGMPCFAFEMLDMSLYNFMDDKNTPMSLNNIRTVTKHLLVAFEALERNGIIHTDVKPNNIMLVNQKYEPFRVKLIDFGLAIPTSNVKIGSSLQHALYRAPEVFLGLPISGAIDMWSLGCVLSFLYLNEEIFIKQTDFNVMFDMCHLLGQPEAYLLDAGLYTSKYFHKEPLTSKNPKWRPKTAQQCNILPYNRDKHFEMIVAQNSGVVPSGAGMAFLDLVKQMLDLDGATRITASQALKHHFITRIDDNNKDRHTFLSFLRYKRH